ncbi:hypothetical protein [Desulfoscipio geothermicus]|uniref:Uncharacterized protein n=1 Tax=Desulfoscipio geothermicus DSM 3669 TaxID=1121426 RepID=A0A1I6DTL3_9FIRM|nr:hypothetical protein [Desulfoscipio geothermicus]SFR08799.1 hypothetical protein SAMN05660706_11758 [Desulfoscipio geothermicus DSM 3669]
MPWTCRLVELKELEKHGIKPNPGDMWFAPWINGHSELSPEYKQKFKGKRPPICVQLPNGHIWCVDTKFAGQEHGWTVFGTPPWITVYPSVSIPGPNGYHGWLVNGVLTDDLEGRTYL